MDSNATTTKRGQIFLSHAHQDEAFAKRLVADLKQRGWQVWTFEDDIRSGQDFVSEINRGLAASKVFVLVATPVALASHWVNMEINAALALEEGGLGFFIAEFGDCNYRDHPILKPRQRAFFTKDYDAGLIPLLAGLERHQSTVFPLPPPPSTRSPIKRTQRRSRRVNDKKLGTLARRLLPTLVIGLGGTGGIIVTHLKALLVRNFGQIPDSVKLFAFDVDRQLPAAVDGVTLENNTEFIYFGGADAEYAVREGLSGEGRFGPVGDWLWGHFRFAPERRIIDGGAQQYRQLGRLALYTKLMEEEDKFTPRIREAVASLNELSVSQSNSLSADQNKDKAIDARALSKAKINVFLISSTCGGTGSGTILDMAYLVRHVIEHLTNVKSYRVSAVLVLPEVFGQLQLFRLRPNTHALLKEIEYFSTGGKYSTSFSGALRIESDVNRPFDVTYLIGGSNENRRVLDSVEKLSPMVANAILLQITARLGGGFASGLSNAIRKIARQNLFSSFGIAALVIPTDTILDICAHQVGKDLIDNDLVCELGRKEEEAVKSAVIEFFDKTRLGREDAVRRMLCTDKKNNAFEVANLNLKSVESLGLDDVALKQEAQNFAALAGWTKKTLDSYVVDARIRYLDIIENARARVVADLRKRLLEGDDSEGIRGVRQIIADGKLGARGASEFLKRVEDRMKSSRAEYDNCRKKLREEIIPARQRAYVAAVQALEETAKPNMLGFKPNSNTLKNLANGVIAEKTEEFKAELEEGLYDALWTISNELAKEASTLAEKADVLIGNLQKTSRLLEDELKTLKDRKGQAYMEIDVTDDKYVQTIYNREAENNRDSVLLEFYQNLYALFRSGNQKEIQKRFITIARKGFGRVKELRIRDVLKERTGEGEINPNQVLFQLRDMSVPFWSYHLEKFLILQGAPVGVAVVGVEDDKDAFFESKIMAQIGSVVSTYDPRRVIVFQTRHGLPLNALLTAEEYAKAYENEMNGRVALNEGPPPHIFPELQGLTKENKRVFAMGLVFGVIHRDDKGTYYCEREKADDSKIKLADTVSGAMLLFVRQKELVEECWRVVTQEVNARKKSIARTINAYIKRLEESLNETGLSARERNVRKELMGLLAEPPHIGDKRI